MQIVWFILDDSYRLQRKMMALQTSVQLQKFWIKPVIGSQTVFKRTIEAGIHRPFSLQTARSESVRNFLNFLGLVRNGPRFPFSVVLDRFIRVPGSLVRGWAWFGAMIQNIKFYIKWLYRASKLDIIMIMNVLDHGSKDQNRTRINAELESSGRTSPNKLRKSRTNSDRAVCRLNGPWISASIVLLQTVLWRPGLIQNCWSCTEV